MIGMFCKSDAATNEEYARVIKRRMVFYGGLFLLGVITLVVFLGVDLNGKLGITEDMISFFTGTGSGLIGGSAALLIKNKWLLKNDEELRRARIEESDERNMKIVSESMKVTLLVQFIAMYLVMAIGGLWYPVLIKMMSFLICLCLFVYCISYKIMSKKY